MIYLVYFIFIVFGAIHFDFIRIKTNPINAMRWYWFCFIVITLIAGLRYNIGADTINYASEYSTFPKLDDTKLFSASSYQPGWILIEATFRSISPNFIYLQFFVAFLTNFIFFQFIWEQSKYPFFSLLVYFVINFLEFDTEILRESLSICMGLLMYSQLQKRKFINAMILLMLAFSIHMSASVLLLLVLLARTPLNKLSFTLSIAVCLLAIAFWTSNAELSSYLRYFAYRDEGKFESYFVDNEIGNWRISGYLFHYVKWLIIPSIILYIAYSSKNRNYSLVLFGYILFGILSHNSIAFLRASNYFAPFYWIVVADAIVVLYNKNRTLFNKSLLIIVTSFLFGFLYSGRVLSEDHISECTYTYERYFPYKSILSPNNSYLYYVR